MPDKKNENTESEFPGYPHYPAREDIMNSKDNKRLEVDIENFSRSKNVSPGTPDKSVRPEQANGEEPALADVDDDSEKNAPSDADLNEDDLIALGEKDSDYGSVERLSGDDLDIPGAEADNENEAIGEEDEENNYYSLGGDAHENLEEDKGDS